MTNNVTKYSAVFLLVVLIISLRIWDHPFEGIETSSGNLPESLEFLRQDPPTRSVSDSPADRPLLTLRDFSNAMVQIAENANPTVVTVFTERTMRVRQFDPFADFFGRGRPQEREYRQSGQGSGVIVSSDGYILTNNHVIQNADTVNVRMMNNRVFPARVLGADPETDIAVLKIDARDLPSIALGNSDDLRVGEWILAIGSPLAENLAHTVTSGIVSAKGRSGVGLLDYEDFIQTDAAINPGNSGGALINLDGELVGINTAIASRSGGFQGIGFAIPINMARNIMRSIIEHGRVVRTYVGVRIQNIDENIARAFNLSSPEGVLVASVEEGSPAERGGLKDGDVIIEADNRRVNNVGQFRGYIASKAAGDRIRLKVIRDDREMTLTITVSEMPAEEALARAGSRGLMDRTGFAVSELTNEQIRELGIQQNIRGVLVSEIDEESAAFRNNLRKNDVIVGVNRRPVRTIQEYNQLVGSVEPGQVVLLQVVRGRTSSFVAFEIK